MKIKAVYELVVGDVVRPLSDTNTTVIGSEGPVARSLGISKPSKDLTIEDRSKRLMVRKPNYKTSPEHISKLYPEDNDTRNAIGELLRISFNRSNVLNLPSEELTDIVGQYFDWCMDNKYPVNKSGLITWLGITRTTFDRHINSDKESGEILQKAVDFIDQMRISLTDEGKINPVWNMFMMANDHGYTRSDPKAAINIQINGGGYNSEEIESIIDDVIDVDDF